MAKNQIKKAHHCSSCGEPYRKADYSLCPFCGSDGGGITTRTWKPNKYQKKEFIKKMKSQE